MHNLSNSPAANLTNIGDLVAQDVKDRFDPLVQRAVSSDHHCESRLLGANGATADWRVQDMDPLLPVQGMDAPDEGRGTGRAF